jgi:hypothetical protein
MSFTSLSRLYVNELYKKKPEYIFKKCKILKVNDNLTCFITIGSKRCKLYLKGVPKKKILKNYLKYLCENKDIYVKVFKEEESNCKELNNIKIMLGTLHAKDKMNINTLLIERFNYLKKKYIYERTIMNNIYKKKRRSYPYNYFGPYKPILTPIEEEEELIFNNPIKMKNL